MSKLRSSSILVTTLILAVVFIQPTLQQQGSSGSVPSASPNDSNASSKRIYCGPLARSGPDVPCTLELNPVCGYNSSSSEGVDAGNPCAACVSNLVEYYYEGECKDQPDHSNEEVNEEDSLHKCNHIGVNPADVNCLAIYDPACAYKLGEPAKKVTVGNDCTACNVELYDFYTPGTCAENEEKEKNEVTRCIHTGANPAAVSCLAIYDPVCAYFDNDTTNGTTVGNDCTACGVLLYDFYTQGECPGDNNEEEEENNGAVRCARPAADPADVMCLAVFDPVCAYFDNDTTNGVTVSNDCYACGLGLYDYYIPGACPEDVGEGEISGEGELGEGLNSESGENGDLFTVCELPDLTATSIACTMQYEPVCAYRFAEENGSGTTVGNSCVACFQQGYDYYSKGECANNNEEEEVQEEVEDVSGNLVVVRCEKPDLPATDIACTLQYEPVCAYLDSDADMSNGKTVGNACGACLQSGYDYYTNGACEGDASSL